MRLFDLEQHFAFYGAHHRNPVNIGLHAIFVWPIFFTALMLLYFTPTLVIIDHSFLIFNYGLLATLIYAVYYVGLDRKAGSLAAFMCFICWVGSSALAHRLAFSLAWKVGLASQLLCWTAQFLGHGVFEKRSPAVLDNLVQAILMAPYFVLLEGLQFAFGYEPYTGFHAAVQAKIEDHINAFKDVRN